MTPATPSRALRHLTMVFLTAAVALVGGLTLAGTQADASAPPTGAKGLPGGLGATPSAAFSKLPSATAVADTTDTTDTTTTTDTSNTTPTSNPLRGVADYLLTRKGVVQVALFDKGTGKTYLFTEGPAPQYTASIVKADILAMWLKQYQSSPGPIAAAIPYSIQYLMQNMITMSDNVAATSLFYFGGGCAKLTDFNTLIPTADTKVGCETPTYYGWGNTTTTAADQVAVVKTLAYDNDVLTPAARDYGLHLMESVTPTQRFGVSCGPWGTACNGPNYADPVPGVTVALKNGWKYAPSCVKQDATCPWQVNSMGWVQGQDRDYVLAVLTTDDPSTKDTSGFDYGIATIQGLSQRIWDNLAPAESH
jgi:Beta-lactamase enzyme family